MTAEHPWRVVGQQWHVIRAAPTQDLLLTRCGWLIRPSALDARLPDPPTCLVCTVLTASHQPERCGIY